MQPRSSNAQAAANARDELAADIGLRESPPIER
jgi:hypothetical protein